MTSYPTIGNAVPAPQPGFNNQNLNQVKNQVTANLPPGLPNNSQNFPPINNLANNHLINPAQPGNQAVYPAKPGNIGGQAMNPSEWHRTMNKMLDDFLAKYRHPPNNTPLGNLKPQDYSKPFNK